MLIMRSRISRRGTIISIRPRSSRNSEVWNIAADIVVNDLIDLNTSFTGEDSLDVSIDAGNANGTLSEFDFNGPDESLTVDGVSYTFPVGDSITAIVGDLSLIHI
mgnify:CR=1 FL=1